MESILKEGSDHLPTPDLLSNVAEVGNRVIGTVGSRSGRYMTMALIGIDLKTGQVHYINAGHPPIYLISEGYVRTVRARGSLLGMSKKPYEIVNFKMEVGNQLFVYSDGLTENEGPNGDCFDSNVLKRSLNASGEKHPEAILNAVLTQSKSVWQNRPSDDDCTILVVRLDQLNQTANPHS